METTVIIGAGASGLICGHELAKSNHNVIILEQSNKAGRKILASGNGRKGHLDVLDVRGQPGYQGGRGKPVDVGEGKFLNLVEHVLPEVFGKAAGGFGAGHTGGVAAEQS